MENKSNGSSLAAPPVLYLLRPVLVMTLPLVRAELTSRRRRMVSEAVVETEVKSAPDKFWAAVRDSSLLFPRIFPHKYQSIEIVEGDGRSAGTVRLIKYAPGVPWVTFAKEKIEEVDDEKKQVLYSVLDGELAAAYKSFKAVLSVDAKGDGSLVKWRVEYEKASEEAPEPDLILGAAVETFAGLDEHLAGI